MSHTKELIEEALDELEKYLEEKHLSEDILATPVRRTGVNKYFNKLGIQVVRVSEWQSVQKWHTNYFGKLSSFQFLRLASNDPSAFDTTYELLADEQSKHTFDWYVKYRTAYCYIGDEAQNVFPTFISREEWLNMEQKLIKKPNGVYEIDNFRIEGTSFELVCTFLVEQYRYFDNVKPQPSDIVFDIGAYMGETALWFSKYVGQQGLVYSFEPLVRNYQKLLTNVEANQATSVEPVKMGLSDKNGKMSVEGDGGAAALTENDTGEEVEVTTIDHFMQTEGLEKIDFIKMDVEGHEIKVLKGASATIRKFSPKLAISVYHRGDDLIQIPKFIMDLEPNYKLYLRHCSPDWRETVLYAEPVDA